MLCGLCGGHPTAVARRTRRHFGRQAWKLERLTVLFCEVCGAALPALDPTEQLLAKLSQLARFGLTAEGRVLVESTVRNR
jgi:hypothetical protein